MTDAWLEGLMAAECAILEDAIRVIGTDEEDPQMTEAVIRTAELQKTVWEDPVPSYLILAHAYRGLKTEFSKDVLREIESGKLARSGKQWVLDMQSDSNSWLKKLRDNPTMEDRIAAANDYLLRQNTLDYIAGDNRLRACLNMSEAVRRSAGQTELYGSTIKLEFLCFLADARYGGYIPDLAHSIKLYHPNLK